MSGGTSRRAVTIRDVAERAQVAISTVSHAFSASRPISQATRDRVIHAAAELGYEPDPSARSLRTGRAGILGLVLRPRYAVAGRPDQAETFNRLVGAVATEMLRRKTGLIHVPDLDDPAVARVPMDGCIVAHPYGADETLRRLTHRGIPTATIEEDPERADFTWTVRLDYTHIVTALLEHLHEQGASEIELLSGTEDNAWNRRPRETYLAWCARNRIRPRTGTLGEGLATDQAAAQARDLLCSTNRPDAIVVATSDFAALVVAVATDAGLRVPDDVMVASLTDSEHTRTASPAITAMDLNHESLAEQAVELILARISDVQHPPEPVVTPLLHKRGSTAAL